MKIAVTSQGKSFDSPVDPRFGRARYFLIVDTETGEREALDNTQSLNAMQGAGIQAAETVCRAGVSALLTGHCGPKAFRALAAGGVKIYVDVDGTVQEAVENFKINGYEPAASPDVEGHW
jgi:predicted Fe-Mo cluster-binding NifX family protein